MATAVTGKDASVYRSQGRNPTSALPLGPRRGPEPRTLRP